MPTYTVQQGDCLTNIADQAGLLWTTVWNHPSNAQLRDLRKDPNVLNPGDQLFVPDKDLKLLDRPTDQKHTFVKKCVPAKLKIRLLDDQKPRAGVPYQLVIDGALKSGSTDSDGYIQQPLPPNAQRGKLTVGDGATKDVYDIQFGGLDPVETESGVRGRLLNLGYGGDDLSEAIKAFQQMEGLTVNGQADADTQTRLKEKHGQ